tara:strand:- start:6804 stop:7475 length:672 start_codon:yes stop_codon:yes gene_type:complete
MDKKTLLVVGIGGSLGKSIYDFYKMDKNFNVYGTSTKINNTSETIFYLNFCDIRTINKLPEIKIDHIIIASGYKPKLNLKHMTEEHLNKMFEIHLIGPIMLFKKLQNNFSDESSITMISSPAAWQGSYDPAYSAVKGATNSLVRTLAKDFAPKTRVNALSPSLIKDSTVYNGMSDDFKQKHIDNTLNKKLLKTDQCIQAIDFIIKNQHFTGQILHLNGGMIYG